MQHGPLVALWKAWAPGTAQQANMQLSAAELGTTHTPSRILWSLGDILLVELQEASVESSPKRFWLVFICFLI